MSPSTLWDSAFGMGFFDAGEGCLFSSLAWGRPTRYGVISGPCLLTWHAGRLSFA
jgi:hypothetical protein